MNPRVAAASLIILLSLGSEISAQTNDELLDECVNVGKAAGLTAVSQGCQAVKDKCPQGTFERTALENNQLFPDLLLPGLVRDTCKTLYETACRRAATEQINAGAADDECLDILLKGPSKGAAECNSMTAAVAIFKAGLTSCSNFPDGLVDNQEGPCACAEDGVSNGIDTGRPGCKEHGKIFGDPGFFCYVVSPSECQGVSMTESTKFPTAFWKDC
ncbi:hypothetical protein BSKO_08358 [Bryopsis sp. KO-2023]|nr:hypothetical protein BSKO_08358 [Bryopsis sp. KO-2023]